MSIIEPLAACNRNFDSEALFAEGRIRVLAGRLDAEPEVVVELAATLSPAELARARQLRFDRDRRRFVVARARLRQLLGTLLDLRPADVPIVAGMHGKPMLGGRHADAWHFNLARAGDFAIYALSAHGRVGIDIEAVRPVRGADEIVAYFFSPQERAAYRALPPGDRTLGFLNGWTRKEAFVKALGNGLSFRYDRFDVSLAPGEPARLLRVDGLPGARSGWRMETCTPRAGFVAALVAERMKP